jgi:hypothetical protein
MGWGDIIFKPVIIIIIIIIIIDPRWRNRYSD